MSGLFKTYRVLAFVVGILLIVGTVGSVLKYGLSEGGSLQELGEDLTPVWLVHGWVYMVYVVIAFVLTQTCGLAAAALPADDGRGPGPGSDLLGRAPGRRPAPG